MNTQKINPLQPIANIANDFSFGFKVLSPKGDLMFNSGTFQRADQGAKLVKEGNLFILYTVKKVYGTYEETRTKTTFGPYCKLQTYTIY